VTTPARKWLVLLAVGASTFMSALDISVVNTILPLVARTFHSTVDEIEWVAIVYLLAVSGLLLGFGRLGDLRGNRGVFLFGFILFIASSALCGLAPTALVLIAARVLQAVGAAMLSANSPAILTKSFPAEERGRALGLQATLTYLGLTVGPTLGGWLADTFGNVPVGLLALALGYFFIPADEPSRNLEKFDFAGAALFMVGLSALMLGLNQGHAWGWISLPVIGLILLATVLLTAFVFRELHIPDPVLDLRLFKNRMFSMSVVSAVLNYICVYSILFLIPFYLIQGRQFTPSQTGVLLSSMPVMMAIVAPLSGALSDKIGVRLPGLFGMLCLAIGLFMLAQLSATTPWTIIALGLAISGIGIGAFISPNNSALMGAAPRARQGIAAGVLATARNVGMVLGIGISGAVFTTVIASLPVGAPFPEITAVQTSFWVLTVFALLGIGSVAYRTGAPQSTVPSPIE
jgi:EmrB/QacA subfamily drug resistance transporter